MAAEEQGANHGSVEAMDPKKKTIERLIEMRAQIRLTSIRTLGQYKLRIHDCTRKYIPSVVKTPAPSVELVAWEKVSPTKREYMVNETYHSESPKPLPFTKFSGFAATIIFTCSGKVVTILLDNTVRIFTTGVF